MSVGELRRAGRSAFAQEQYEEAVTAFTQAIELLSPEQRLPAEDPELSLAASLSYERCLALTRLGRLEEALTDALSCIKSSPSCWRSNYILARTLSRQPNPLLVAASASTITTTALVAWKLSATVSPRPAEVVKLAVELRLLTHPQCLAALDCAELIMYPRSFIVLDPAGAGHHTTLEGALELVKEALKTQDTTLVVRPGNYQCFHEIRSKHSLQILGDLRPFPNKPTLPLSGLPCIRRAPTPERPGVILGAIHVQVPFFYLQHIEIAVDLPEAEFNKAPVHGLYISGPTAKEDMHTRYQGIIRHCHVRSNNTIGIVICDAAGIDVQQSSFEGTKSGILVFRAGSAIRDCLFHTALLVRGEDSVAKSVCNRFVDIPRTAITVDRGAARLILEDTTFERCGLAEAEHSGQAVVAVSSALLEATGCRFLSSPASVIHCNEITQFTIENCSLDGGRCLLEIMGGAAGIARNNTFSNATLSAVGIQPSFTAKGTIEVSGNRYLSNALQVQIFEVGDMKRILIRDEGIYVKFITPTAEFLKIQNEERGRVGVQIRQRERERAAGGLGAACDNCSHYERNGEKFRRCGRCRRALYCSPECQKAHWKAHKHECQDMYDPASQEKEKKEKGGNK